MFRFSNLPAVNYPITCAGMNERRAVRAFEAVANAMSPGEKASIRDYWFNHQNAPSFIIEDTFMLEKMFGGVLHVAIGMNVTGEGLAFRFAGRAMHHMTDILVETIIAHEIAHAVIRREIQDGDLPDEEDVLYHQLGADLGPHTEWLEGAVNRRILSWNDRYDDQLTRDWLNYYVAHGNPPPSRHRLLWVFIVLAGGFVLLALLLWWAGMI
jgi:hypothetical protein